MNKIIFVSVVVGAAASSHSFRVPRDTRRFPIEYRRADDGSSFPGLGVLEIGLMSFHFTPTMMNTEATEALIEARGITLSNGELSLDFGRSIRVLDAVVFANRNPIIHIPAGPGTSFAASGSGFVITPVSETEDLVIINPQNVNEFAFEGQIFYTPQVQHPRWYRLMNGNFWGVSTAVRVVSGVNAAQAAQTHIPDDHFVPCAFLSDTPTSLAVPRDVFENLMTSIEALGISINRGPYAIVLSDVTEERLGQLPTLEYFILSETGEQIHLADLLPAQYLAPVNAAEGEYSLTIYATHATFPDFCSIDSRIMKNLLIHFDTLHNRIGFGEPLVEL